MQCTRAPLVANIVGQVDFTQAFVASEHCLVSLLCAVRVVEPAFMGAYDRHMAKLGAQLKRWANTDSVHAAAMAAINRVRRARATVTRVE